MTPMPTTAQLRTGITGVPMCVRVTGTATAKPSTPPVSAPVVSRGGSQPSLRASRTASDTPMAPPTAPPTNRPVFPAALPRTEPTNAPAPAASQLETNTRKGFMSRATGRRQPLLQFRSFGVDQDYSVLRLRSVLRESCRALDD